SWLMTMRMMVWWNSMSTAEYSSSLACSVPFSKVANIARGVAISSRLAFCVIRRAAMLSSAAQAVNELDHFLLGLAHHVDAAARHRAHEPFALELRHRFAHRRAADAGVLGELPLVQPHFGRLVIRIGRHD